MLFLGLLRRAREVSDMFVDWAAARGYVCTCVYAGVLLGREGDPVDCLDRLRLANWKDLRAAVVAVGQFELPRRLSFSLPLAVY